ncbi:MAG TPA: hypothetical protein VME45_19845 [Stellaceae bacterium]|nr:hypothetical protein [Stellaceae bacterium]
MMLPNRGDQIVPERRRHASGTDATEIGDPGIDPRGEPSGPPIDEADPIIPDRQPRNVRPPRRLPRIGKFIGRIRTVPVPKAVERVLDGHPIDHDIEHREQLAAPTFLGETRERRRRIPRTEPVIQPFVIGGQEQIARAARRERRRDRDRVKPHGDGPIQLPRPRVNRAGEKRMKIIKPSSGHPLE